MRGRLPFPGPRGERGAALVTAALALLLITVLAVTFMTTISGERSMSSNVQVARGSLFAADAGVRAAQQQIANVAITRLDSLYDIYPGSGPMIKSPDKFFPIGDMVLAAANPKYTTTTTIAFADSQLRDTGQVFNFRYRITSNGSQGALGQRWIQSDGVLKVSASRGTFADYLIFTDKHTMGNGSAIWFTSSGHFDGRVHTNGKFRMAYKPTFEDLVTSVDREAIYYNKGNPISLDANNNGSIDMPDLYGGFDRGQTTIPMPKNNYNQQNAALGLSPANQTAPSGSQVRSQLGMTGTTAPPDGIYMPVVDVLSGTPAQNAFPQTGKKVTGGIYIQGNLSSCVTRVDSLGRQVYVLRQGSTTRTITVDETANLTFMSDGTSTSTYLGTPRGVIFGSGDIDNLGGPGRDASNNPLPGLANRTELLITAKGDITLNNDIVHTDYDNGKSVLGIYASNGDVIVGTSAPNDMHLDAYVMAGGDNGEFRVDNYNSGSPRGTFHLRGGMVSTYYGVFYTFDNDGNLKTGYGRDFHYDRRGLVPPYYPTTSQFQPDVPRARTLAWKEI